MTLLSIAKLIRFNALHLNSSVIVLTADQPIYALAKQLQWKFPELFREHKIVMMMRDLHIEKTVSKLVSRLSGSGWTDILIDAGITSPGRTESFFSYSRLKRSTYRHKVTVGCCSSLIEVRSDVYSGAISFLM